MILFPPPITPAAGAALSANNLSDLASAASARTNLEVFSQDEANSNAAPRALAPFLLFDGATSGRVASAATGAQSGFSALAHGVGYRFRTPATAPSSPIELGGHSSTAGSLNVTTSLGLWLDTSMRLEVRRGASTIYTGKRYATALSANTWYSAYWHWEPDGTVTLYVNGILVATDDTSGGTPLPFTDVAGGENIFAGRGLTSPQYVPVFVLGALTAAEILTHAQTGLLPDWCYAGTGSAVSKITGTDNADFAGGTIGNWTVTNGGTLAIVANQLEITVGSAYSGAVLGQAYMPTIVGRRYRLTFDIVSISTGTAQISSGTYSLNYATGLTAGLAQVVEFTALTNVGLSVRGAISGAVVVIDNLSLVELGPIAKWAIQPGAVTLSDSGSNRIPMLLTSGVTALGDKPEQVSVLSNAMTADGFVLADQVIAPTGYELVAAYATQTGTETSTITVKETSSGGTTCATGAMSASALTVALTVSNGLLAGGKKLHLANSSWASNTVQLRCVFRRAS